MSSDLGVDRVQAAAAGTLLERARAAVPILAAHAARTEQDRRVAAASLAAAQQAGAFRMRTPTDRGGHGADLRTTVAVLAELGRGCPSTAWLAGVSAEAKSMFVPLMSDEARNDVLADPDAVLCGTGAPPGHADVVDGGLRVSGRWNYASGCEHATWAGLMVAVAEQGRPVGAALAAVPIGVVSIEHTWDSAGLRGTGSHTLVAQEVFVPTSHIVRLGPDGVDLAQRPMIILANTATLLAPVLGAARGAHDVVASVLGTRRPPGSSLPTLSASVGARQWFGEATRLVDSAGRRVHRVADEIDGLAPGDSATPVRRAGLKMELVTAAREAREAVDRLLDLHGSSGFAGSNPLQRFWRDLHVGTRHVRLTPYLAAEDHDRALLDDAEPAPGRGEAT
jgi:alkylation response protein AidB-like acyl-CoA dehydrogenase